MPARFSLVVLSGPQRTQGSLSAFRFAQAALAKQHEILTVFFYADGTYHGNRASQIPQDETDMNTLWQSLAQQYGFELKLCSGSALRRGVNADSLLPSYQLTGLGELANAYNDSDRVLVFGT